MNSKRTSNVIARQMDSVRKKKIKKLKNRIVSGKYQINNMELAISLFMAR